MKLIFHFCTFLLVMTFAVTTRASPGPLPLRMDSSRIDARTFEEEKIDEYKNQREFDYRTGEAEGMDWWDRFWYWFWQQFERLMENQGFRAGINIFLWALAIGVVIYAILKIIGMDKIKWLIRGRSESRLPYSVREENIHVIDYVTAINEAINRKEFRLAIRLLYLKSLKGLSDRGLIQWKMNKTNLDYLHEMQPTTHYPEFRELTGIYEYAWYGEFPVNQELFTLVRNEFDQFEKNFRP